MERTSRFLPRTWTVYGVDIARTQLVACRDRYPRMNGRLAWAEAECLPFPDGTFDACYSIGGFTYYEDHAAALREMRRVTRAGGPVVVADEIPGMHRAGIGHLIGTAGDRLVLAASAGPRRRIRRHGLASTTSISAR